MTELRKRTDDQTVVLEKTKPLREARENAEVERVPGSRSPETPGEDQDGFEGSVARGRQMRRQDNIESFDAPDQRDDEK
jgi:hypothetical protein